MSDEHQRRVEEVFDRLIDLPPSERAAHLEAACRGDQVLAADVVRLLDADAAGHPLLDHDAANLARAFLESGEDGRLPGQLGRYVIRRDLGQGGMGSVFLAEREDLGDHVALKLLHDPWNSPRRRERFASEQRTLASLSHRHIARLYDAGVTSATPWFAMEYVEGTTIVAHCNERRADLRERLLLYRAACEAVSYAHRHLIVHLDLKPSNVLVSRD